ncbi:hypothetical protein Tdes44962_MAKER01137 [Teratosphaeria destructans]|uniref:Uncharacterized protein n=1 Tax=Teratosphaeria destructans TaxID=418781 RepID=A0A9W7W7Y6_9PEZI|nr:hypothetical protein Tdes44962_MAKER01137 [Teratosphaeria destructans]
MTTQINRSVSNVKRGLLSIFPAARHNARIHWVAPTLMFGNLALGLAFAIGHHEFYNSLAGTPAPTNDLTVLGTVVSQQQINIAIGTAMAYIVKSCFEVAISIAFVQVLFRVIRLANGGLTVEHIDTASSALTSIWAFIKMFLRILRNPSLIVLGILCWLLPLATVVTPATLTIDMALRVPLETVMARVPTLDFRNLAFASSISAPRHRMTSILPETYTYGGPSVKVQGIAKAVGAGGGIHPFISPYTNASWNIQFPGPALQCSRLPDSEAHEVKISIANWTFADRNCYSAPGYLAWMQAANGSEITPPFTMKANTSSGNVTWDFSKGDWTASAANNANATFYMALLPGMLQSEAMSTHSVLKACITSGTSESPLGNLAVNASLIRCDLVNATYNLDYEVINSNPLVKPEVEIIQPATPVSMVKSVLGPDQFNKTKGFSEDCVRLIMEDGTSMDLTDDDDDKLQCVFDEDLIWRMSYQSVLLAFSSILVGSVSLGDGSGNMLFDTSVLSTAIGESKELAYLRQQSQSPSGFQQNLQAALQATNNTRAVGLTRSSSNTTDGEGPALIPTMEQLFQNLTISLLSSRDLLPNAASATVPPAANVTLRDWQNTYTYSAYKLWLAYGLALLCGFSASLMGIFAILVSGASYSNSFSAILRIARQAHLTVDVLPGDADGRDPLPEYIAKARVRFGGDDLDIARAEYPRQVSRGVDSNQKGASATWIPLEDRDAH